MFPASAGKNAGDIGALQHTRFNRGNITAWLEQKNQLNRELWDRFLEKPIALNQHSTEAILDMFAKGAHARGLLGHSREDFLPAGR